MNAKEISFQQSLNEESLLNLSIEDLNNLALVNKKAERIINSSCFLEKLAVLHGLMPPSEYEVTSSSKCETATCESSDKSLSLNIAVLLKFSKMSKNDLLLYSIDNNNVRMFKFITDRKDNRKSFLKHHSEYLYNACINDSLEIVKLLLEYKAPKEICIIEDVITETGNLEIIKLLLEHKIPLNEHLFVTAIAENGDIEIVKLLLKYKVPINEDAIKFAVLGGNIKIVKLLLKHGAPLTTQRFCDALRNDQIKIAKLLARYISC